MPVPTFISSPRDGLPGIFENGEAMAPKKMFDVIDQIGWVIDENPGAHLIAHNTPLNDSVMYIRVDTDEALIDQIDTVSFLDNTTMAVVRVFPSLADAQNETNALTQLQPVRGSAWNASGSASQKINYGWIGDSRTAYLIVSGIAESSTLFSGMQADKFHVYVFGEISRASGDPGASVFGGGNDTSGGDTSFLDNVNNGAIRFGGLTNSIANGPGLNGARAFSSGLVTTMGRANGNNDEVSPFVSTIFVFDENNGPMRGWLPGIVVPALGMDSVPEGIQEGVGITTKVGAATGLMVPMHNKTDSSSETAWPVYFDLSNDWDLYHAA